MTSARHKWAASRSFVFTEQLQNEWDRRYRAHGNQRPADCSPLFSGQLFRKQQRDASAEHCTRAGNETDLRNGDFVLFHVSSFNRNSNPSRMARRQVASRRFKFLKGGHLFIRTHDKTLSVALGSITKYRHPALRLIPAAFLLFATCLLVQDHAATR